MRYTVGIGLIGLHVLFAQGNVGVNTATPSWNLEVRAISPTAPAWAGLGVSSAMTADGLQSDVAFHLVRYPFSPTNLSKWSLWMADPDGGHGVVGNGWEIWEYPADGGVCCRSRFRIYAGSVAGGPAYINTNQEVGAYGFFTYSDGRYKEVLGFVDKGLARVMALRPVTFYWRDDTTQVQVGFLAQEVERAIPEAVRVTTDSLKGIDYVAVVGTLVRAMQELYARVEALERRKEALLAENRRLRAALARKAAGR